MHDFYNSIYTYLNDIYVLFFSEDFQDMLHPVYLIKLEVF